MSQSTSVDFVPVLHGQPSKLIVHREREIVDHIKQEARWFFLAFSARLRRLARKPVVRCIFEETVQLTRDDCDNLDY
jgi:hypothetical protein